MTRREPPAVARWLLRRLLPPGDAGDTIRGDLYEEFDARGGSHSAAWWFRRQALSVALHYAWRARRGRRPAPPQREAHAMWLDHLRQDVRFALRSYVKAPSFTAIVITTLALGIGASTAIFSLVNGILMRPLPFPDPDRLVFINEINGAGGGMSVSWPNFLDWRARVRTFDGLAASRTDSFTLTGGGRAERLAGRRVTGNFFQVLGMPLAMGRPFSEVDDGPGASPIAVISHGFWKRRFGGTADVLGRSITLDDRPFTIVGVLPAAFRFVRQDDVYVPVGLFDSQHFVHDRGDHAGFFAVGRLARGATVERADAEVRAIDADLERQYPASNTNVSAHAEPFSSRVVSTVRSTLLVLFGAVGLLLLIACVNVANLLVSRGAARRHELAVRAALGGGRARLFFQMLVESTLLTGVAAAIGTAVAMFLVRLFVAVAPAATPRLDEVRIDGTALLFTLAAAVVCGVVFGALPAVQASGIDGQALVVRSRTGMAHNHRLRSGLMIVEVALALILLVGAGLMARTLYGLSTVDIGFSGDRLLTMHFSLEGRRWNREKRLVFVNELLERVRAVAGVERAAATSSLPIEGSTWNSVFIAADKPIPRREDLPSVAFTLVSPGYFETMDMRLVRGRPLTMDDTASAPLTAVVNEALARRLWLGEDPIGKRLKQGWPESPTPWREVVGVVGDVKFEGLAEDTPLQVYVSLAQEPDSRYALVVRTAGERVPVQSAIETAVRGLDADLPLYASQTMRQMLDTSVARERTAMIVLLVFAGVAVILASAGLYGVVSHGVTERTHEIGVRMALGAEARHVLTLVVQQGLTMAVIGTAIGLVGALALSRGIQGLLFGITPADPLTFSVVAALLLIVALAACYLPARRAARVDPTIALRAE